MASNKEIETGAKAIADDMALPGGGLKKLARVVGDHLDWFDLVERRGLTWGDISRLLFVAGVKSVNGRPISIGTLSSTVWRKRPSAESSAKPAPTEVTLRRPTPYKSINASKAPTNKPRPGQASGLEGKNSSIQAARAPAAVSTPRETKHAPRKLPTLKAGTTSKAQTLDFMKRAAAIRRKQTD